MCVKMFYFKCVYIGQPVSEISEFLTAYIHKCTVKTIDSYNASCKRGQKFVYKRLLTKAEKGKVYRIKFNSTGKIIFKWELLGLKS